MGLIRENRYTFYRLILSWEEFQSLDISCLHPHTDWTIRVSPREDDDNIWLERMEFHESRPIGGKELKEKHRLHTNDLNKLCDFEEPDDARRRLDESIRRQMKEKEKKGICPACGNETSFLAPCPTCGRDMEE